MKTPRPIIPLDTATLRKLAVRASCDPRTIRKVAAGVEVRGLPGDRARQVLEAINYPLRDHDGRKAG